MQKSIAVAVLAVAALSLSSCGRSSSSGGGSTGGSAATDKGTIGVAMPTKVDQRWIKDGAYMKRQLEAIGYKVDLEYANNDIPTQVTQINNMITKNDKALVIASINGTSLKGVLSQAKSANIPVIAYDRLLMQSDAVDYYTTFDNLKVGKMQAQSLIAGLTAKKSPKPWNIELFAGSPDDNNATFFYNGAMQVLKPLIASGQVKVPSGETAFNQIAIQNWDEGNAKKRMENVLTKAYSGSTRLDGVLSPYDGLSRGILAALSDNGYGTGSRPIPVVTGQDAELESVKLVLSGQQYSTIFKNTRNLAAATVKLIQQLETKQKVTVNDTKSYNNGVKVVPTELLQPVSIDKSNAVRVLTGAKYYTLAELK